MSAGTMVREATSDARYRASFLRRDYAISEMRVTFFTEGPGDGMAHCSWAQGIVNVEFGVAPCSRTLHELIISTVMILVKASKRCLACALGMCF